MKLSFLTIFFLMIGCSFEKYEVAETSPRQLITPVDDKKADILTKALPKPAIRERLFSGSTLGNIGLQNMTLDQIKSDDLLKEQYSSCKMSDVKVVTTWAFGEPSRSEYSAAFDEWNELWEINFCGKFGNVNVRYLKHVSGIISASVRPIGHESEEFPHF